MPTNQDPMIEVDLQIPGSSGRTVYLATAQIHYNIVRECMSACYVTVDGDTIDCLAGSDTLAFDAKPIAALCELLAVSWLESAEGVDWIAEISPTVEELRTAAWYRQQGLMEYSV